MKTKLLRSEREAADLLASGVPVAFPTETVFGLGASALDSRAVSQVFQIKGRPSDNPLIVHLADWQDWSAVAKTLPPMATSILAAFSPGPISLVLPKKPEVPDVVTAGLESVAIRIPSCPIARLVIRSAGVPIAAPSANLSGRPSATTWQSVLEDLEGRLPAILCKNSSEIGLESTVVDCCGDVPLVLRPGAISLEQLRSVVGRAEYAEAKDVAQANSPGLRHAHYQPLAKVHLFDRFSDRIWEQKAEHIQSAICGICESIPGEWQLKKCFPCVEDYASGFYEFLRQADRAGVESIYVQRSPLDGIGIALLDRQRRAAGEW